MDSCGEQLKRENWEQKLSDMFLKPCGCNRVVLVIEERQELCDTCLLVGPKLVEGEPKEYDVPDEPEVKPVNIDVARGTYRHLSCKKNKDELILKARRSLKNYSSGIDKDGSLAEFLLIPAKWLKVGGLANLDKAEPTAVKKASAFSLVVRKAKAATALVRQGHLSKAAAVLNRQEIQFEINDDEIMKLLEGLHPAGKDPMKLTPRRDIEIDAHKLRTIIFKGRKGAAPGPSGWTEELIAVLAKDRECLDGIRAIVSDICNDSLSPKSVETMTRCILSPLPKTTKTVRPIAVGEVLLKIAAAYVFDKNRKAVAEHFGYLQRGVQYANGTDSIIHEVRKEYDTAVKEKDEEWVCATYDGRNAFNVVDRIAFYLQLLKNSEVFSDFFGIFNVEYGVASDLVLPKYKRIIKSRKGSRQGSTLGGFLFCLAIHPVLKKLSAKHKGVTFRAYMDDITLTGNRRMVAAAFKELTAELAKLGIEINASKSEWLAMKRPPADVEHLVKHVTDGIKLLGGFIGNGEFCTSNAKKVAAKMAPFTEALELVPYQVALLLLCKCGCPRATFTARVNRPEHTKDALAAFDTFSVRFLSRIARMDLPSHSIDVASLPTRHGGLGLMLHTDIRHLCYQASVTACIVKKDQRKIQRSLIEPLMQERAQALGDTRTKKRLLLQWSEKDASFSLDPQFKWPDRFFSAHIRRRLMAILPSVVNPHSATFTCSGCKFMPKDPLEAMEHWVGCTGRSGRNASTTHTNIKREVFKWAVPRFLRVQGREPRLCRTWNCFCSRIFDNEQAWTQHKLTCTKAANGKVHVSGPDDTFTIGERTIVVDYSSIRPASSSNVGCDPAKLILARNDQKNKKYKNAFAKKGQEFIPLVILSGGGCSKELSKFADDVETEIKARKAETADDTLDTNIIKPMRFAVDLGDAEALREEELMRAGEAHPDFLHMQKENEEGTVDNARKQAQEDDDDVRDDYTAKIDAEVLRDVEAAIKKHGVDVVIRLNSARPSRSMPRGRPSVEAVQRLIKADEKEEAKKETAYKLSRPMERDDVHEEDAAAGERLSHATNNASPGHRLVPSDSPDPFSPERKVINDDPRRWGTVNDEFAPADFDEFEAVRVPQDPPKPRTWVRTSNRRLHLQPAISKADFRPPPSAVKLRIASMVQHSLCHPTSMDLIHQEQRLKQRQAEQERFYTENPHRFHVDNMYFVLALAELLGGFLGLYNLSQSGLSDAYNYEFHSTYLLITGWMVLGIESYTETRWINNAIARLVVAFGMLFSLVCFVCGYLFDYARDLRDARRIARSTTGAVESATPTTAGNVNDNDAEGDDCGRELFKESTGEDTPSGVDAPEKKRQETGSVAVTGRH